MVHLVAPTPLRLVHGTADPICHVQEAQALYERAGAPKDLCLIEGGIHQLLSPADSGEETANQGAGLALAWFDQYLA